MYINPIFFLSFFQHKYDFIAFVYQTKEVFLEKKQQHRKVAAKKSTVTAEGVGVLRLPDLGSEGPCRVLLALWTAIWLSPLIGHHPFRSFDRQNRAALGVGKERHWVFS